jgi:hypothetical protein
MGYQGLGGSDAMTDDEPNSVSMEQAMQAIRDALGYRDNLEPQRELISNLPRDNDFLIKRLAAIEERKANDAQAERLCQSIPLITDCIKKMWLVECFDCGVLYLLPEFHRSNGRFVRACCG